MCTLFVHIIECDGFFYINSSTYEFDGLLTTKFDLINIFKNFCWKAKKKQY